MKKNIHLIIGNKGFIGQHLLKNKYFNDKKLIFLDKKDQKNNFNLKNFKQVYLFLNRNKPNYIWNVSGTFTNNLLKDFNSNVLINFNFFESIRKLNLKTKMLVVGTSGEYGKVLDEKKLSAKESDNLNPFSLYAWSKISLYYLMKYFYNTYNLNIVYARIFNIYGDGISKKLFPGRINNLIDKKKINLEKFNNLDSKRDYSNIKDVIEKIKTIMLKGSRGNVYNVGSNKLITNYNLIKIISFQKKIKLNKINNKKKHNNNSNDLFFSSNNSKFNKL